MPKSAILDSPEVAAKRRANSKFVHIVTAKCVAWGKANGYGDLLAQFDAYMATYKAAQTPPNYYESQTPERLMEMVANARRKMDKAMAALGAKSHSNGHA